MPGCAAEPRARVISCSVMTRSFMTIVVLALFACEPIPSLPPPPGPEPTEPPRDAELLAARRYTVKVPTTYDDTKTWPLLLVLHSYGGTGQSTAEYFGLTRLAEQRGLFLIAPDGLVDRRGNRGWDPGPSRYPEWDRSWLSAVLRDVKAKYRIDASRVFVFGHSQGAHMANRMGCDGADDVTGFISVAGQVTLSPTGCLPQKKVSALLIHGTADEVIGYYGDLQNNPPSPNIPSAHQTATVWARNNGCTGMLEEQAFSPINASDAVDGDETVVEYYAGCPADVDVALWTMKDVPHRPDPATDFGSRAISFLSARPRP